MKLFGEAFNTFANRADPDQAALVRNTIRYDPALMDPTSNLFVLSTNVGLTHMYRFD